MTARAVILSGGINHDFNKSTAALANMLSGQFKISVFDQPDDAFSELDDRCDLFVVNTLRWRMLDDDKYIPHRQAWAYEMREDQQDHVAAFLREGGGLLALHTAAICFDTWTDWHNILGGGWKWGQTFHPEPRPIEVRVTAADHEITKGLVNISVTDEVYHHLERKEANNVLLETTSTDDGSVQPVAWYNHYGEGRIVYSSIGHDAQSLNQQSHTTFIKQAADWAGRR